MKRLIIDLDGTITHDEAGVGYVAQRPRDDVVRKLREYREQGFSIVIATARSMRTHNGNVGLINVHTLPLIIEWLDRHNVPYDEIVVGKPWCGHQGFYVDDKALRPDEFARMNYSEISALLGLGQIND